MKSLPKKPEIREIDYHGWSSLELNTGAARLVVPRDIGPRVISLRLGEGANLFHNVGEALGQSGEDEWELRGGHRLWHSPEDPDRTYELDNFPIEVEPLTSGNGLNIVGNPDEFTRMQKRIEIEVVDTHTFKITHTLENQNLWPVACAPWSLSVMEKGGFGVIPLLPKGNHETDLLPSYSIVPWTYTDFTHPCWRFERDFIGVDMTQAKGSQKIGLTGTLGWSAYWQEAGTFVKYAPYEVGPMYPDRGCVFEAFCCDFMIELEALGPLECLEPGEDCELVEWWGLLEGMPRPDSAQAYADALKPAVDAWMQATGLPEQELP
ncbi:MAG: hypothetical protein ACFB20_09950 [Opitutales bacterium]